MCEPTTHKKAELVLTRQRIIALVKQERKPHYYISREKLREKQLQPYLTSWRGKVVEWLQEFVDEFGVPSDVVAVSIFYLDIYTTRKHVPKQALQLLAMVCIFVASKFHETNPIRMEELTRLAESNFCADQVRTLEMNLLKTLEWQLNPTTPHLIMQHLATYINDLTPETMHQSIIEHAEGFCDYSLTNTKLIGEPTFNVAIAALRCALRNHGFEDTQFLHSLVLDLGVHRAVQREDAICHILMDAFHTSCSLQDSQISYDQEQQNIKYDRSSPTTVTCPDVAMSNASP